MNNELTQEQLVTYVTQIVANLQAEREALIQAGQTPPEITEDMINAKLSEILAAEGIIAPEGEAGEKADDPAENEGEAGSNGGVSSDTEELVKTVIKALGIKANAPAGEAKTPASNMSVATPSPTEDGKSFQPNRAMKSRPAPTQRKYSNFFIGASVTGNSTNGASDFKSRLEKLSGAARQKEVYSMFGRAVKCSLRGKGDLERAAHFAEHGYKDLEMAHEFKALSATVPSDGGYLVPEMYSKEVIELLYPTTAIYELGARRINMPNGNINIPKTKSGTRATFIGENRTIPKSSPKFSQLKLSAKKLTALVPMSNDLLRNTNFDNDVIVGQDLTKQMALGIDTGAFLGTGGEFMPLGITKNRAIPNIDVTTIGSDYADASGKLTAAFPNFMVSAVLKKNVYANGLGFVFNTSVEQYFKSLRDNVGGFIFADEMNAQHTLAGYKYRTTNILETEGDKTVIIFGDWTDLIIGEQGSLEVVTSTEATWTDESGKPVSAFENDQTLIRAIDHVDIGVRHEESFAVATKVAMPM